MQTAVNNLCDCISRNKILRNRTDGKYILRQEARLTRRVHGVLKTQMEAVIRKLENIPSVNKNARDVEIEMNDLEGSEMLSEEMIAISSLVYFRGTKRTIKEFKKIKEYALQESSPDFQLYLESLAPDGALISGIDKHTRNVITGIISEGVAEGKSYQEIATLIREQGGSGVFSRARSKLIAVTETGRSYGTGRYEQLRNYLVRNPQERAVKKWITAGDDRVRETHIANAEMGWIPVDQVFDGTREMYAPSSDFNCRCDSIYDFA